MDRRSFGGIPGIFGIVGDSYVKFFLPDTDSGWCPLGVLGPTAKTLRSANWGVGMLSLCSFFLGATGRVSGSRLRPGDRNGCHHWY